MSLHLVTGALQAMSSTRDVSAAEERIWKKETEFSRSSETAWQSVIVELAWKFAKKAEQLALAKVLARVSNGVGNTTLSVDLETVEIGVDVELDALDDALLDAWDCEMSSCSSLGATSSRDGDDRW